ncbi:MAG: hypothetical protein OXQ29_19915 [Rhodospirillaceae bacterium]|nr:hypothetical protein [Rhodospirillaceae bacterium]
MDRSEQFTVVGNSGAWQQVVLAGGSVVAFLAIFNAGGFASLQADADRRERGRESCH